MKKNAVHNAFFFLSDFLCNILVFAMFSLFSSFFILKIMTTGTCLLFFFFLQNSLFILILMFCAKKKSILWGKHLKNYMHIYTVHKYVQMYICV